MQVHYFRPSSLASASKYPNMYAGLQSTEPEKKNSLLKHRHNVLRWHFESEKQHF